MNAKSALFATIMTNLVMNLSEKKNKNRPITDNRELTIPEKENNSSEAPGCMLFVFICILWFCTGYEICLKLDINGFFPYILVSILSAIPFVFIFIKLIKMIYSEDSKEDKGIQCIRPTWYQYLDISVSKQTEKNFPDNLFYCGVYGKITICNLEEYLCGIGKEIVFDKTPLKIQEEDCKLIERIIKLKDDTLEAKNDGDIDSFNRGKEILERWLMPYQFESKDETNSFSDINDIPYNDIIVFARATIEMLCLFQKETMQFLYLRYAGIQHSKTVYDNHYYKFCDFVGNNKLFSFIDILIAFYNVYTKLGAPRIIPIENENIYNRPKRIAMTESRISFLYNPKYLEESNY